ncbi:carbohydrate ABC transporter permease [Anaerocolumna sp. MB42-C2]|uniref:carbohydrate ABC transporter permease n=1 Tax=Anaerocolumna sp. MB42-C2 TaxID=3070997 RepID=UPI0027E0D393|nr:sugar ABC transporter permease [Anaerocolumna sp. MB42-C2]WMJ88927.1 sugar ABC transporter permease [Anaerocolumna sp. MB42-C2]
MKNNNLGWYKAKRQLTWYSFIIVSILTLIILTYIPMLTTIKYSFYDVSVVGFGEKFAGLKNYNLILSNASFLRAVGNTVVLALMGLISIPVGFILASLINSLGDGKAQGFFRVGYYFPNIITGVSVILVFQIVLKANDGLLNNALSFITGHQVEIGWLTNAHFGKFGATILSVWSHLGYSMLINLASLQSIPGEVYEAAEVDGATGFQSWLHITIPQMVSCFAFLFITNIIGGLARFTDLFILGGNTSAGRPGGTLQTILMYIYQFSFETPQYGVASAGAMILFVVTLAITLLNLRMTGFFKKNKY